MSEEMKPAVILENPEAHARALFLKDHIKAHLSAMQANLYEVCKSMMEMRDGKLYKELGYQGFEDCCKAEFGITRMQTYKYIRIAENLPEDFVKSTLQIGTEKLSLLAMLDAPDRETVIESVEVESVTVRELKAQIEKLETDKASKDKQFKEALDAKDAQLKAAKESGEKSLSECKAYLNGKIHELEDRIHEMENAPIDHNMTDADAAEEIQRLKRELEDASLERTMLEKSAEAKARKAADAVREEYEQKLAAMQSAQPEQEPATDTKAVFKAYLANAADALTRLMTYLEGIRDDANMPLYVSKVDGIVEMTQTRRNAL